MPCEKPNRPAGQARGGSDMSTPLQKVDTGHGVPDEDTLPKGQYDPGVDRHIPAHADVLYEAEAPKKPGAHFAAVASTVPGGHQDPGQPHSMGAPIVAHANPAGHCTPLQAHAMCVRI